MADLGKLFRIEDYPSLQCSRGAGTPDGRLFAGNNVPDLELQCSRGKCAPDGAWIRTGSRS